MKKIFLFLMLAVLFCFSYSALAEPARKQQPVMAKLVQPVKAGTINIYLASPGQTEPARPQARKPLIKVKIFENHIPETSNNNSFG
jgi:hypothetical protein